IPHVETAEAKNKQYEQEVLLKDQEITSLNHRMTELGAELDKTEAKVANLKTASEGPRTTSDNLTRKVALLEEELDATEEIIKEITEKLRQVDVKAEHFERQVQRIEQECDVWKKKYEDMTNEHKSSQADLSDFLRGVI
ncbi:tropomyosin, partial [Scleroderma citrinum]